MHYKDNIIVVLESENLIIDEHLIIQHLIILFDYQIIVHNLKDAYIDENEISISSEGSDSN